MHFSLATIIAVVPLLASASPLSQVPYVTINISKRTDVHHHDGSVNAEGLKGSVDASINKAFYGFDTYQRNTGKRHPSQPDNYKRAIGELVVIKGHEHHWYGNVSVGTPPVNFTVGFDTGTSDFFLPGPSCDSTCDGHKKYDPSKSSTSKSLGESFSIPYSNNTTVSGVQFTDTVKIAGLTATNQTLGVASHYSTQLGSSDFPADGSMGMGFQSISTYNATPVFQTLISQGQVSNPIFALKLDGGVILHPTGDVTYKPIGGNELSIGGLNSKVYKGTPFYVPITQEGHWQIPFDSFIAGDTAIFNTSTSAIIDSASNVIIGPPAEVEKFYSMVLNAQKAPKWLGDGYYTVPCDIGIDFDDVTFNIGGHPLTMIDLVLGPLTEGDSICVGGIVGDQRLDAKPWIFGLPFLRHYYNIFDYGNSRVGFAQLKKRWCMGLFC